MSAADAQRHLANARARFAEGDLEAAAREAQAGLAAAADPGQRATAIELRALRCEIDLLRRDMRVALRRAETDEESEDMAPLHHAHGLANASNSAGNERPNASAIFSRLSRLTLHSERSMRLI